MKRRGKRIALVVGAGLLTLLAYGAFHYERILVWRRASQLRGDPSALEDVLLGPVRVRPGQGWESGDSPRTNHFGESCVFACTS